MANMTAKKVAFQGERGAYSEVAALDFMGKNLVPVPCETFEILFDKVESRRADFGIIPLENSLVGSIHRNFDLLLERELKIIGETQLHIQHCLIAFPSVSFSKITKVYSHPAALDQCRHFFDKYPTIAPISYYDTGAAVRMISEIESGNSAAIASAYAAKLYGQKIIRKSIEDEKSNYTRFVVLGRKPIKFKGPARTSIVFAMKNEPGVLFKALSVFALRDIDLTKIESRPVRKKAWQYYFYADFVGALSEEKVKCAIDHLGEITHFIKILGCYPLRMK
jgi:prephenate dehydratase